MKTFDWGVVRKEQTCHDKGHEFKRALKGPGAWFICKCGAEAHATKDKLKIYRNHKSREERRGSSKA